MKYYSQIETQQDRWLIEEVFKGRTIGTFLDVGAGNGVDLSNTYALEQLGWQGICVEPNPASAEAFRKNRPDTTLDTRCLWNKSGTTIPFIQADIAYCSGIQKTIGKYMGQDVTGKVIHVPTITFSEFLDEYNMPDVIDYLSLDTEGSEAQILFKFPHDLYRFNAITVEHNYEEPKRTQIRIWLEAAGYVRVRQVQFDDWYLHRTMLEE